MTEIWRIGRCPGCTAWIIAPLRKDGTMPAHDTSPMLGGGECNGAGERPYETVQWDPEKQERAVTES